LQKGRR